MYNIIVLQSRIGHSEVDLNDKASPWLTGTSSLSVKTITYYRPLFLFCLMIFNYDLSAHLPHLKTSFIIHFLYIPENGNLLWDEEGVPVLYDFLTGHVTKIITDGNGGAIMVGVNSQTYYENFQKIYLRRLDSDGNLIWNTTLFELSNSKTIPNIIQDGDGGYFIIWKDIINPAEENILENNYDLCLNKLDENGNQVYSEHIYVCKSVGLFSGSLPELILDDLGGCIISWIDMSNEGAMTTSFDLRAQRMGIYTPDNDVCSQYEKGDVNADGEINVVDVMLTIHLAFNENYTPPNGITIYPCLADVNGNGITISDVIIVINKLLENLT